MKRLLAIILAVVMAAGLAVPATTIEIEAQESETQPSVNWDDFYIVTQPKDLTFQRGESLTFSVKVNVPEGVEVAYQWYRSNPVPLRPIGNEAILQLSPDDISYPAFSAYDFWVPSSVSVYCEVTAYEKNDEGHVLSSKTLTSDTARATVEQPFWGKLLGVTVMPFVLGFSAAFVSTMMSFGFGLPFAPLFFLGGLVAGFVLGFRNLFGF